MAGGSANPPRSSAISTRFCQDRPCSPPNRAPARWRGRWAWAAGQEPGIADAGLVPQLALAELIESDFDGGELLKPYPAILDYWARARVSAIGARCVTEMGALVPMVTARRAAAGA